MKSAVIFTQENLLRLKAEAASLLAEASPSSAYVLTILNSFSAEDIEFCCSMRQFPQQIVDKVAVKADATPLIVRQVLVHSVMPALEDYSDYLHRCQEIYQKGKYTSKTIKEEIDRNGQRRSFVLHTRLGTWEIYKGQLGWCLFEDGLFSLSCQGFLISVGRVFRNVIELLRACREQSWPKWGLLWKCF